MELDLMKKVFRVGDTEPFEVLPSGHTAWLLARVGNLWGDIFYSKQEAELPSPCHQEEEFIYVLEGQLEYDDGRVARVGEAIYNLPNIPHPGRYTGCLLSSRAIPETGTSVPGKDLMSKVIRREDVETFQDPNTMTIRTILLFTENISVSMNECEAGAVFIDPGHPEKEIVYVIQGQIEYDDGRIVREGEAIINLPNIPHNGRRGRTKPTRSLEIKSPRGSRLAEMLKRYQSSIR